MRPPHTLGIMNYGLTEFMGIPQQTLIALYEEKLGDEPLSTVDKYAEGFQTKPPANPKHLEYG